MEEKPVEWSAGARSAFLATSEIIHREDPFTADLIVQRVERSLTTLQRYPKTGTPIEGTRSRRALPRFHTCDLAFKRRLR